MLNKTYSAYQPTNKDMHQYPEYQSGGGFGKQRISNNNNAVVRMNTSTQKGGGFAPLTGFEASFGLGLSCTTNRGYLTNVDLNDSKIFIPFPSNTIHN